MWCPLFSRSGKCSVYYDLRRGSILSCFLPLIDPKAIVSGVEPQRYKFPKISKVIEGIVSPKPKDLDIVNIQSTDLFFREFIEEINRWLLWSERFLDTFRPIIAWMKTYNVNLTHQLLTDMDQTLSDSKATLLQMKGVVQRVLQSLDSLKHLYRLCDLFNCLTTFRIVEPIALSARENSQQFIDDLKRLQPSNTFKVAPKSSREHTTNIRERQQVRWSLASEKYDCSVMVEFRMEGENSEYQVLFPEKNVTISKNILGGTFETQRSGQLLITVNNKASTTEKVLWYRLKSKDLCMCHLFDGIFRMQFNKFYPDAGSISENEFDDMIEQVFTFIGQLLDGNLRMREIADLGTVFADRNINIREEVRTLHSNRFKAHGNDDRQSINDPNNQQKIEQICEWLQTYQYFSHINVITQCIDKFKILSAENEDRVIKELRQLSENQNCSLREITEAYKILQEKFRRLSHQHLQLIKMVVEYPNVVYMMEKADLYSDHGQRRFQELRDNLTMQFQLQERNNMILNAWIMAYTLVEPFVVQAANFDDFVLRLAKLPNLEENTLNMIKGKVKCLDITLL